jgi:hypothetical protein
MRKPVVAAVVAVFAALLGPPGASAGAPVVVSGGGAGTFDGVHPGSQFGFGAVFRSGSVQGHFNCVMAGRSAVSGLRLMKVDGQIASGSVDVAAGAATFSGSGTLYMNNAISQVAFTVYVTSGGPGKGTLQLTVDGPPVGQLALDVEHVLSGQITLH